MEKEKYRGLGTKVSPEFHRLFRRICKRKGIKIYDAIQMMAETFVRYTDDRHNLSEEMERMMAIFEHMTGWKDAFNLADASAEKEIKEAIYFLTAKGKKGARAVMVHRPYMGDWTETMNVQVILDRVIEVLMPERYRRLRSLAVDMDCNSIMELVDTLITRQSADIDDAHYRKDFEDCRRGEWGQLPKEDGPYVRKHHKSVDMYEQQTVIQFGEEDRHVAENEVKESMEHDPYAERKWLEDNMDFQPHGGTW